MATESRPKPSFSRGLKWGAAFHVFFLIFLVAAVVAMINYISGDFFLRFHWSASSKNQLSPLTLNFLNSLTNRVKVTVYYSEQDSMYGAVASLLREYHLANSSITIETVDYLRDAGAAQKVKAAYHLDAKTDKDLVIFDCEGRVQVVPGDALAKYALAKRLDEKGDPELFKKPAEFLGERMFSSALLAVTNLKPLRACFLKGHGEHAPDSDDPNFGYLKFASLVEQNYIHTEPLELSGTNGVPVDCNLLIIAGPRTAIPDFELEKIGQYLSQGGRLLALFNAYSIGKDTGLEKVLAKWGVEVGNSLARDDSVPSLPEDVLVKTFSKHPIVNSLLDTPLFLIRPRPVSRLNLGSQAADAPRVEEIAFTGPNAVTTDGRGPKAFSLAVAVEKGAIKDVVTERGTTRIVMVGDSIFLANTPIDSAANRDFAGYAINWLVDRSQLLEGLGPRPVVEYTLVMTRSQFQRLEWILLAAMPGGILALGGLVWLRRRR